jgi:hypothetical protein
MRGEKKRTAALKPLDLGALKERLAKVETETKANDPRALKARIAELERERAKPAQVAAPDPHVVKAAEQRGYDRGHREGFDAGVEAGWQTAGQAVAEVLGREPPKSTTPKVSSAPRRPPTEPASRPAAAVARAVPSVPPSDRPLGAERRPLAVLASVYPAGMTEAQWAVGAGLKKTGGTWSTYVSRLRTGGRVDRRGDLWFATEQGFADIGDAPPVVPPPGPELVEFWCGKIPGAGPMLRHLVSLWPHGTTREELAAALGLAPSGGTFGTYLSRLRTPGLIETSGSDVRAADLLFPARDEALRSQP